MAPDEVRSDSKMSDILVFLNEIFEKIDFEKTNKKQQQQQQQQQTTILKSMATNVKSLQNYLAKRQKRQIALLCQN